ncbi:MAG: DUF1453 domain-containing protein [Acidobacteria bacterium]|nr:MAG: DUF1453 domain-containing protein [Acidobacteriota bacterium]
MPFIAVAVALVGGVLALIALMPLSLVLRYRAGTARRPARRWVTTINLVAVSVSAALLLMVAGVTSYWIPMAFRYTLTGFAGGCLLGLLGLWLSRWEETPRSLHYTPSRALVLAITLVVTARILYGFWRSWHAWHSTPGDASWLAASGAAGSLAAGALVLGYYLAYWAGVWRRIRRHRRGSP